MNLLMLAAAAIGATYAACRDLARPAPRPVHAPHGMDLDDRWDEHQAVLRMPARDREDGAL